MARIRYSDSFLERLEYGACPLHCASVPPIIPMGMFMQDVVPLEWGSVSGGSVLLPEEVGGLNSPFSGVQTSNYWSASSNANNPNNAWNVNLNNGNVNNTNKTNSHQ